MWKGNLKNRMGIPHSQIWQRISMMWLDVTKHLLVMTFLQEFGHHKWPWVRPESFHLELLRRFRHWRRMASSPSTAWHFPWKQETAGKSRKNDQQFLSLRLSMLSNKSHRIVDLVGKTMIGLCKMTSTCSCNSVRNCALSSKWQLDSSIWCENPSAARSSWNSRLSSVQWAESQVCFPSLPGPQIKDAGSTRDKTMYGGSMAMSHEVLQDKI